MSRPVTGFTRSTAEVAVPAATRRSVVIGRASTAVLVSVNSQRTNSVSTLPPVGTCTVRSSSSIEAGPSPSGHSPHPRCSAARGSSAHDSGPARNRDRRCRRTGGRSGRRRLSLGDRIARRSLSASRDHPGDHSRAAAAWRDSADHDIRGQRRDRDPQRAPIRAANSHAHRHRTAPCPHTRGTAAPNSRPGRPPARRTPARARPPVSRCRQLQTLLTYAWSHELRTAQ